MEIIDVFNEDFIKILTFLESYKEEFFTQQTIIKRGITYYVKVSHFLGVFVELGIVEGTEMEGLGNTKLYRFNKEVEMYRMIRDLIDSIEE